MVNFLMDANGQRPKVGIGVIVMRGEEVLMGLRKASHGEGTWSFTGGHLEFGETWDECARREIREEAGIEVKNIKPLTVTNDVYLDEDKHYVTIFMTCDYVSGNVRVMEPDSFVGCYTLTTLQADRKNIDARNKSVYARAGGLIAPPPR